MWTGLSKAEVDHLIAFHKANSTAAADRRTAALAWLTEEIHRECATFPTDWHRISELDNARRVIEAQS